MASVVFFRAVNVGAHQRFQPSKLAGALADLGVVNIGAAGTFVVREAVGAAQLRQEILGRLPFAPELMICPAREILELAGSDPFKNEPTAKELKRYVTVTQKALRSEGSFPMQHPSGDKWELAILSISKKFVVSVRRPGEKDLYPNAVIEKQFGVPATTRNWNTLEAICAVLKPAGAKKP